MQGQALLTQAELAFIRQLSQPAKPAEKQYTSSLQVVIGKQLDGLLTQCAADEQLSLHAHVANQHLAFELHVSQDEQNQPCLTLGTPQIFDEGEGTVTRAWRTTLPHPVLLRTLSARPSNLWIHQLSMNGALIEHRAERSPPERFRLVLPVDELTPITIEGTWVRKTADGLLAYQLQALNAESEEHLRQYLYQQHCQQEQHT